MSGTFPYKTKPYSHQVDALRFLVNRGKYAGLFMEQRTGKTKVIIDEAAWRFMDGQITALLIVAPSGVHSNWVRDEIPLHMTDAISYKMIEWSSSKAPSRWFQNLFRETLDQSSSLIILAMNIEAMITASGKKAARALLKSHRTMMVIDESTDIKSPGAKRTKSTKALGKLAAFRRILSGFPNPESPVDFYAQLSFLSPHIVGSKAAVFRARYCDFEQRFYGGDKPVPVVVGYRNLDELKSIINKHCFRVRREDVFDLPDKVYTKRYFEMSAEQSRMYEELRKEWRTEYSEDGAEVSAPLTIVRLLRLQQIASGYVPTDSGENPQRRIPGRNPRLEGMLDSLSKIDGQVIIWYRYRMDGDLLEESLDGGVVRWDGATRNTREQGKQDFIAGNQRFFIGSPQAAGRGLTLRVAKATIYYSHYWGLEARVQSEDRMLGEDWPPLYLDMLGSGTVDLKIVAALREKDELGRRVIGDPAREWI